MLEFTLYGTKITENENIETQRNLHKIKSLFVLFSAGESNFLGQCGLLGRHSFVVYRKEEHSLLTGPQRVLQWLSFRSSVRIFCPKHDYKIFLIRQTLQNYLRSSQK